MMSGIAAELKLLKVSLELLEGEKRERNEDVDRERKEERRGEKPQSQGISDTATATVTGNSGGGGGVSRGRGRGQRPGREKGEVTDREEGAGGGESTLVEMFSGEMQAERR